MRVGIGCVRLNSGSSEIFGLVGMCTVSTVEKTANEKAALAFRRGVGGEKVGNGNKVTVISSKVLDDRRT